MVLNFEFDGSNMSKKKTLGLGQLKAEKLSNTKHLEEHITTNQVNWQQVKNLYL